VLRRYRESSVKVVASIDRFTLIDEHLGKSDYRLERAAIFRG
jgi:hypothetical protein